MRGITRGELATITGCTGVAALAVILLPPQEATFAVGAAAVVALAALGGVWKRNPADEGVLPPVAPTQPATAPDGGMVYRRAIAMACRIVPYHYDYRTTQYDYRGDGWSELTGLPPEQNRVTDLWGRVKQHSVADPDAPSDPAVYRDAFQNGEFPTYRIDLLVALPCGRERWICDFCIPERDPETGEITGSIGVMQDVTDRKRLEEHLATTSHYDELTGLYNRRGFLAFSGQHVQLARRMHAKLVLIFVDLDHMKWINDTFGHSEGDNTLRETSSILRDTFRGSDIVARIGGDEFVVLTLESAPTPDETYIGRLQGSIDENNTKSNRRFALSVSYGIARAEPAGDDVLMRLLRDADRSMYDMKRTRPTVGPGDPFEVLEKGTAKD